MRSIAPQVIKKKISKLHQELKELSAKINGLPDNPTSNQDNLLNLWQLYESVIKRSAELSHNIEIINKVHAQFEKMHIHTRVA